MIGRIKRNYLIIASLGVAGILLLLPVPQQRILTRGTDAYNAHKPLFGDRQQTQSVILEGDVIGAGAILVDMRRTGNLVDVIIIAQNAGGDTLGTATIPSGDLLDDKFASAAFPEKISQSAEEVTFTFSAPDATAANPVGLRTDIDAGGTLAMHTIEQIPAWKALIITADNYRPQVSALALALLAALTIIVATSPVTQKLPVRLRRFWPLILLLALIVIAAGIRLAWLPQLYGVSGGDPYNYLSITKHITELKNPFAGVKRLPGLPFLLVPSYLTPAVDDLIYMRSLSITSAVVSLALLALLARQLKFPLSVQIAAPALVALQKDFFWTSLRPEPYTLYTALLLASLVLYFYLHRRWAQILFGFMLGCAAMTRQEGFILAAILALAALTHILWAAFQQRRSPARQALPTRESAGDSLATTGRRPRRDQVSNGTTYAALGGPPPAGGGKLSRRSGIPLEAGLTNYTVAFIPALLIVLPFFIHNWITFDNPFYTRYFEGERLQIVDSPAAFKDNAGAAWGVLNSIWRPQWNQLDRVPFSSPIFAAAVIAAIIWWAVNSHSDRLGGRAGRVLAGMFSAAVLIWSFALLTNDPAEFIELNTTIPAALLIAASPVFLAAAGRRGLLVWLVLVSQLLVATWFHPFAKHYQQSLPLVVLMITALVIAPPARQLQRPNWQAIPLLTFLFMTTVTLHQQKNAFIDQSNNTTALDHVTYQAVQAARAQSAPHGFDAAYQQAILYFGDQARYFLDNNASQPQQQAWLAEFNIQTLVATNASDVFSDPGPDWHEADSFRAEGKNERIFESKIYTRLLGAEHRQ